MTNMPADGALHKIIDLVLRHRFIILGCLLACVAYQFLFINRAHVDLTIQVKEKTFFKIYWAGEGQAFSERRVAMVYAHPERKKYSFFLTDLRKVKLLRIDPHQYIGTSRIKELRIRQIGLGEINLSFLKKHIDPKSLAQIDAFTIKNSLLEVQSSGKDPSFFVEIDKKNRSPIWFDLLPGCLLIILCLTLIAATAGPLLLNYRYIAAMLLVALTVILTMSVISERDVHPDEEAHVQASKYYTNHWLPPAVDAGSIRDTYSQYGSSRLNTDEIYYLLNGKFARAVAPLQLSEISTFRLFNVLLFGIILLYLVGCNEGRLVAAPLLISAQAWYQFSYCNSEAFALVIAFFVGCQVVIPESMLNRYLFQQSGHRMARFWLVVLLFSLLFVLKKNFLSYAALVFLLLMIAVRQTTTSEQRLVAAKRLLVLFLLSLSLLAVKKGADYYENGFNRSQKIRQMRDEIARPMFNPESPRQVLHPHISMKNQGYSPQHLIEKDRWFEKTFRSAFGVYGYSTISGSYGYYDLVRYTGAVFALFFFGSILWKAEHAEKVSAACSLAVIVALIAASFYHSWTKDFQPQGRYLLPILPMLGIICARNRNHLHPRLFAFFLTSMFLLAVSSFIWTGIANIPHVVGV